VVYLIFQRGVQVYPKLASDGLKLLNIKGQRNRFRQLRVKFLCVASCRKFPVSAAKKVGTTLS
jgi:hypothetical protein